MSILRPACKIRLKLRSELSPKVVSLVKQLASSGQKCNACKFCRHEPVPQSWGQDSFYGPPYALLQGSLADMAQQPPFEGSPAVKKANLGHVKHHPSVADEASWQVIARIPTAPYTNRTDGAITTRWLTPEATVPFNISLKQQQPQQEPKLQPS
ncbi:hypothetical protein OEZ85_007112 [Tetradesmus obliquus]|uniref:Uncharacterized protein n=1 Tax=Tetradesmus obliquus TaxID=3088 RepID=A0ABY8TWR7_TETOB|nr:hypothetical protein OEZ85_007112 [Tetradesmus obliquus]